LGSLYEQLKTHPGGGLLLEMRVFSVEGVIFYTLLK